MAETMRFDGRVAIVTGAGGGLGRAYALLLAARGAKVVVNDLGGSMHGEGADTRPADQVVAEIREAGGEAVPSYDSVEEGEKIVQTAIDSFGRVDIVVNNAGILRDVSFHRMRDVDWEKVYRVHLFGSYKVTRAAWPYFREQQYGRVVMTSSAAGLYGNFGQANYSAAKLGILGLAHTLAVEGLRRNIYVNTIAPIAGSRLTATILPPDLVEALKPEYVAPLVAYLCHESCTETGRLFEVGAGWVSRLRWERSKGVFFPLNRPFSPEQVADRWPEINDFTDADHPDNAQASFAPVLENLKTADSPAKPAGNEFVDLDKALGFEFEPKPLTYTERDVSLYALSVGAAEDPLDPKELQFVYEMNREGFKPLPTFAVTFPFVVMWQVTSVPGLKFNPMMLLHGEQYLELKRPLPTAATIMNHARISQIYDKGKGALVIVDINSYDEAGNEVAFNQASLFIRGIGGFGGERGPSGNVNLPPDRAPDAVHAQKTSESQALLYRLSSGDRNPLHVDPDMAAIGGFNKPILHGLCTFGFAARAVLKHFANNDPERFKSIRARFTSHVFPGETLVTEMWQESETRIILRTKVAERDEVVLANAAVELHPADGVVEKQEAETAVSSRSQTLFAQIQERIAAHPEWVEKVGAIYQFRLTGNDGGNYVVDLKNSPGRAYAGEDSAAQCTLIMDFADFLAMTKGELDPQMAFMSGKLKIEGNVMLATRLQTLFS